MRSEYWKFRRIVDKAIRKYQSKKLLNKFLIIFIILIVTIIYPPVVKVLVKNQNIYSLFIFVYVSFLASILIILISLYSRNVAQVSKKKILGDWIDNIYDDNPIYDQVRNKVSKNTAMENIEIIKKEILSYCEDSEEKLRLLKGYYSTLVNNDRLNFWYTFIGLIVLMVGYLINAVLNKDYVLTFLDAEFHLFHVIMLASVIIVVIYNELSSHKNKSLLILNLLEEIVELKSKENK